MLAMRSSAAGAAPAFDAGTFAGVDPGRDVRVGPADAGSPARAGSTWADSLGAALASDLPGWAVAGFGSASAASRFDDPGKLPSRSREIGCVVFVCPAAGCTGAGVSWGD